MCHSISINIPKHILNLFCLKESQHLNIEIKDENIVIEPLTSELETLLEKIKPTHIHNEISFGSKQGKEV